MEHVTVRQLAEELQVSKVSINNRIDKLNLRDELVKAGNRYLIPEETADVIRESFRTNRKTEPPQPDTQAVMLDILSEQLKEKDRQIQSLMNQLELLQSQNTDLLKSVREHSYLLLQANGISEPDAEEAGNATDPDEKPAEEPKKKSWFSRFFG